MERKKIIIELTSDIAIDLLEELNQVNEQENGLTKTNQLWTLREILKDELNPEPKDDSYF